MSTISGDIDDEEELLDWLTDPSNMEMTDHIEKVNRKMFEKICHTSDYVAVFFCKYGLIFYEMFTVASNFKMLFL